MTVSLQALPSDMLCYRSSSNLMKQLCNLGHNASGFSNQLSDT